MGNSTALGVNAETPAAATKKRIANVQPMQLQTPSALIGKYAGSQQQKTVMTGELKESRRDCEGLLENNRRSQPSSMVGH